MKVTLIRHGETNYNVKQLCSSKVGREVFLSEKGIEQAKLAAEKLKDSSFDIIIVSEMFRTQQTASIINESCGVPIFIDSLLNEHNPGEFEGRSVQEYWASLDSCADKETATPGNSESHKHVKERIHTFLENLKKKKQFSSVLIVTHEAIIRYLIAIVKKLTTEELEKVHIKNCQITTVEI